MNEAMRASLIRGTNKNQCICESLRLVYDEIIEMEDKEKKERITEHLVDCMVFAKKMADRLDYYKATYHDTTGSGGSNLPPIPGSVRRRNMRSKRSL